MSILNNPTFFDESNTTWYWKLDWDATDSIWSNNGTASNVTYPTSSRWYTSECGSFNGSSSKVSLPTWVVTATNEISFNIWFKRTTDTIFCLIWNTWPTAWYNWVSIWYWLNFAWEFEFVKYKQSDARFIRVASTLNTNWNMLTAVQSTSWMELFLNWVSIVSSSDTLAIIPSSRVVWVWYFSHATADQWFFAWEIWEVRIINATLSEQEIQNLYQQWLRKYWPTANLPTFTTSLSPTAFYPLNWDALDYAWSNDWTPTSITYSPVWGWEIGTFNWTSSNIANSSATLSLDAFTCSIWINSDQAVSTTARRPFSLYTTSFWLEAVSLNWWHASSTYQQSWNIRTTITTFPVLKYTTSLTPWTWYYCVCTYSWWTNWDFNIYLNWVNEWSTTIAWTPNTAWAVDIWWFSTRWWYFDWNIWLAQIYNTALNQTQIDTLYNEWSKWIIWNKYSLPLLQTDLELHLTWANNWTTTLYDQSGNAVNWTVSSTPTYYKYWLNTIISLSSQSISWASTTFNTATCWEKVSWTWELQINPAYITTTWVSSWTREITDIRLYSRTLSSEEQDILLYWTFIRTV